MRHVRQPGGLVPASANNDVKIWIGRLTAQTALHQAEAVLRGERKGRGVPFPFGAGNLPWIGKHRSAVVTALQKD